MRSFIGYFVGNRTAVVLFTLVISVFGIRAYQSLPREAAPDLKIPVVLVTVPYPGVSPTDMETLVVHELEKHLKELRDVKVMRSTAAEGAAIVNLEFNPDIDIDDAVRKVREKVDQAKPDLPTDALEPVVQEISFEDFPILSVVFSANYSAVRLKEVAENIQEKLEVIQGVLEVKLTGGVEREIQVLADPDRLAFHGTSIDELLRAVQGENINLPGGAVEAGRSSFLVRVPGEFESPHEIEEIVVKTRTPTGPEGHTSLRVKDVARVLDTFKEKTSLSRINGTESVTLQITKRGGENLIHIADEVKRIVEDERARLPPGTTVTFLGDQSKNIRSMVTDLENNILTGLLLILLVLPFFLTLRSSFIVASAIPLSLFITMMVLQGSGITLNMIVLFSLILALGMLVDNSIVVVENTYRLLSEGRSRVDAAILGASEVAWPVLSSTATTVAAFVPLLGWPGIMGKFMGFLPRTLIITLVASLFVSLCVNPVMNAVFLKVDKRHVVSDDAIPEGWLYRLYHRSLVFAVGHKAIVIVGTFVLLIASVVIYGSQNLGVQFFPEGTPDTVTIDVRAADGTRLAATDEVVEGIEAVIDANPHVANFTAEIGIGGNGGAASNLATLRIDFKDEAERTESSLVTIENIRAKLDSIAGAKFEFRKQAMGPPSGSPVGVEIIGDDWTVLGELTAKISSVMAAVPNLVDLKDDFNAGRPEVQVRVDRERAKVLGTSTMQVAQAIRTAINGSKATTLRDGQDEYEVIVRLDEARRIALESVEGLVMTGRDGFQIPLREVATVVTTAGAGSIRHKDRERVITIGANTDGRLPDEVRKDVVAELEKLEMPPGYRWRLAGENEEQQAAQAFLSTAFMIAFFGVLMIIIMQFNSILAPLIIMTSVILSLIGVFWGLIVFQQPFGVIMTGLGVISLAGVAVNNAIVLIDFIRKEQARGLLIEEAVVRAGVIRLRPVLLTAITTVLGLLPMVFGVNIDFVNLAVSVGGRSGEIWRGMAVAVSFGLTFTTFLTLVVVPVLYISLETFGGRVSAFFGRVLGHEDGERAGASVLTPAAAVASASDAAAGSLRDVGDDDAGTPGGRAS
jgi:multidrug efflux pump